MDYTNVGLQGTTMPNAQNGLVGGNVLGEALCSSCGKPMQLLSAMENVKVYHCSYCGKNEERDPYAYDTQYAEHNPKGHGYNITTPQETPLDKPSKTSQTGGNY